MQFSVVRKRIRRLLNAAAGLLAAFLLTACLAMILTSAGDLSGGEAIRALAGVILVLLAIVAVTLLGHLAIAVLFLLDYAESSSEGGNDHPESNSMSSS